MAAPSGGMAPPMPTLTPLSLAAETAIRLLPGNDRCVDCLAVYPQWAGVSFGVLLCLACAGKHRSLGVTVSFVKSLALDSWSRVEQRAMEAGGNGKWTAVCAATHIADRPLAAKYDADVSAAYKRHLQEIANSDAALSQATVKDFLDRWKKQEAEQVANAKPLPKTKVSGGDKQPMLRNCNQQAPLSDCSSSYSRHESSNTRDQAASTTGKATTCCADATGDSMDGHSARCKRENPRAAKWLKYERTLGAKDTPLGFSLVKTQRGFAEVTQITPGGAAEREQVVVGSFVVGVDDCKTSVFDDIVKLIAERPRPLTFHFALRTRRSSAPSSMSAIPSVSELTSSETELVFHARTLGCSLQVRGYKCVVTEVEAGGEAKDNGVMVGSRVIAVNAQRELSPAAMIHAIQKSDRPVRITFHLEDGLLRGGLR